MSLSEAATRLQAAISTGKSKPKPKRPNAVRRIMDREQSRERRVRESSLASNTGTAPAVARPSTRTPCANKACPNPKVIDGTCQTCGSVGDESNIVSEITFGETSSGAAVVHGTNVAADQAGVRVGGLAFRRVAGGGASEARERSLREAKTLLNQFAQQLRLSPNLAETAYRFYRDASINHFVQGRRKINVAAICLYAACRKAVNNKVMLIDLADIIKTDVFLLGRGYKEFLNQFPDEREGTNPIILEDLIYRFASKLEFYHDTNKVAVSAVRIAARMRYDNMTHGRRPAGICGAAIIMAARAHNYRRTVREVVYIAKVTMATLQERMEEFAMVPSAQMTVSEFNEIPMDQHSGPSFDPPFVYKNSQEYKEKHTRPRKRKAPATSADNGSQEGNQENRNKRARVNINLQAGQQPAAVPGAPASTPQANSPPVIDKDGFVVPPLPQHVIDPALRSDPAPTPQTESTTDDTVSVLTAAAEVENQLDVLVTQYGDDGRADGEDEDEEEEDEEEEIDPTSEMAMAVAQGIEVPGYKKPQQKVAKTPAKKKTVALPVNEEWEMDEANLEQEVEGHLNDPALIGASQVETKAIEARRAKETAAVDQTATPDGATQDATPSAAEDNAETNDPQPELEPDQDPNLPLDPRFTPRSKVSDDPIVHEDEFKDDPEVEYCMLGEFEIKIKEQIWSNHNKDYLRSRQQKQFNAKLAENAPKKRRQRARKPRIGEGQASPAGSAEEAAVNMIRSRGISKKINYSTLGQVFDLGSRGPGSTYGGASSTGTPNTLGSVAGSEMGSDDEDDQEGGSRRLRSPSPRAADETTPAPANGPSSSTAPVEEEEEEGDDDDYNNETGDHDDYNNHNGYEEEETFAEEDYDPFADNDDGNENGYDDTEY